MDDIGPAGVSQALVSRRPVRPGGAVAAQSGDVDADGQIVDELTVRLRRAIGPVVGIERDAHLACVRADVERRRSLAGGWAR